MTSATVSGSTVNFKYDPFGRRIQKSSSSGTTNYLYDGANVIEQMNSAGALLARFTDTQNVDESLAMTSSGVSSFYEQDGLGSVTSLTNSAGSLAQTYTFDSFGNLTNSSGSVGNTYQYTSREYDLETGLYYYRARYYDPTLGRFLSEDPTGGWPTQNLTVKNELQSFENPEGAPQPGSPTRAAFARGGVAFNAGFVEWVCAREWPHRTIARQHQAAHARGFITGNLVLDFWFSKGEPMLCTSSSAGGWWSSGSGIPTARRHWSPGMP